MQACGHGRDSSEVRLFYRIARNDPPSVSDMSSHLELGIPLRRTDPESLRMASGISLFDSIERARKQAKRKPWWGKAYIAEVAIPLDHVRVEKTAGPGHYTAWCDPNDMLTYVRRVERV